LLFSGAVLGGGSAGGTAYYLFYFQNYHLASTHFKPAFPSAFNHTWSLAVEEQFYLLWPLIVRYSSLRVLKWTCVGAIGLAPLSRALLLHLSGNPYNAITPLVANVDALALGAILAAWLRTDSLQLQSLRPNLKLKNWTERSLMIVSIAVVGIVFAHDRHDFWIATKWLREVNINVVFTTVLSLFFALLLIHVVLWNSWFRRVLEIPLIAHIGTISYGIYMFHGLVLTYAAFLIAKVNIDFAHSRFILLLVNLVGAYLLALASWTYLERPFLKLKGRFA
jgi:peptidoglycan/LPS O-acetylase OafA/YrhL